MNYLIFPHLGLGDQLIMNGFLHYILETQRPNRITIIAYDNYQNKTLDHLYSDISNVDFYRIEHPNGRFTPFIESLNGKPFMSPVQLNGIDYKLLNFGVHSQYRSATLPNHSWADSFYLQGQLDPSHRFSYFKLPSNMRRSEELYNKIVEKVGKNYILINDEPKSNRNLNGRLLQDLLYKSNHHDLPVIYLGLGRYQYPLIEGLNNIILEEQLNCISLLDLWGLIQNATECHFMDSSIACMTDLIPTVKGDLHLHAYATETVDPSHPIFVHHKWSLWYKEDLPS
jgi:hypothetical protein